MKARTSVGMTKIVVDVTIITEDRYVFDTTEPTDWYSKQVVEEDRLLFHALERHGLSVTRQSWSSQSFDWSKTRTAIFRSTWDYFDRLAEFNDWLSRVRSQTHLINSYDLIRWNLDKHYLNDLCERDVPVVPTSYRTHGSTLDLASWCEKLGGDEWVLKPVVSGAAKNTFRFSKNTLQELDAKYRELIEQEDLMLQPFLTSIPHTGEVSIVVIGSNPTHAVLKKAKEGDFRVQDDFGGTVQVYQPTSEELSVATRAVAACSPSPLYARVDLVRDNSDMIVVSELELIEPELWFRTNSRAADLLAQGVAEYLESKTSSPVIC